MSIRVGTILFIFPVCPVSPKSVLAWEARSVKWANCLEAVCMRGRELWSAEIIVVILSSLGWVRQLTIARVSHNFISTEVVT